MFKSDYILIRIIIIYLGFYYIIVILLPSGERCFTVRASISPVPGVQLDVSITAALVLEEPRAPATPIGHLVSMTLESY